jgi:hypothetical protein
MSEDNRDKQFAGWAKATFTKMFHAKPFDTQEVDQECEDIWEHVLARAGYDLVEHAIETADYSGIRGWIRGENIPLFHKVVQSVPDMIELPTTNQPDDETAWQFRVRMRLAPFSGKQSYHLLART